MPTTENNPEEPLNELQWISEDDYADRQPSRVRTPYKILVPLGVLVTSGILGSGIYQMYKRDSRKQQLLMRYRVLAQGITLGIVCLGFFHLKPLA